MPRLARALLGTAVWAAVPPLGAHAQVQNLRFDDTDSSAGAIGGIVYWDQPAAGTASIASYAVFLSTSASSGGTESQVGQDVTAGAWTSELAIPAGTSVPSGATYLLVYTRDTSDSLVTGTVASVCLKDLQTAGGYARTLYFTTKGYKKAYDAKNYLASASVCAAQLHRIEIQMVSTAYYDSAASPPALEVVDFDDSAGQGQVCADTSDCGAHECTGGFCQSSTASFLVSLPTDNAFQATITGLSSNAYMTDAPVPPFYTGDGTTSSYSLGLVQASSILDGFVPVQPDPDIARYLSKSLVQFEVATAAIANRLGDVRILARADRTTAVNEVVNIFLGYRTTNYVNFGAESGTETYITDYSSSTTQAQCWQITSIEHQPSCT